MEENMKKSRFRKFLALLCAASCVALGLGACKNNDDDDEGDNSGRNTAVVIHLLYASSAKSWKVWPWQNGTSFYSDWPNGLAMSADSETGGFKCTLNVNPSYDLGFLFVATGDDDKTADITVDKSLLSANAQLYFIYGDTTVFTSAEACTGLKDGEITASSGNTISLSVFGRKSAGKEDFSVKGSDGTVFTISNVSATDTSALITLSDGDISKRPYTVTLGSQSITANIAVALIDTLGLKYDGDDLGLTLNGTTATFKAWAPSASSVSLLLYSSATDVGNFKAATVAAKASGSCDEVELEGNTAKSVEMESDSESGVWATKDVDVSQYKYYKYKIVNGGTTYYVADIWHTVASADSIASQIASIDDFDAKPASWETAYTNPFGSSGSDTKAYSDAVIYEMHIRDWSRAVVTDSTGKFLDIANSEKIMEHLKDLGVTHVQILPMFDYAQVNSDTNYNWGYNPYHYNVPEGRYVTAGYADGTQAVREMRQMIKTFHDNGIAVIMDVVYNHTNGTQGGSLYDSTVPKYFYRTNGTSYYNGSGCGNVVAGERTMVKKYIIDSLKHWVTDYHINGFRFDLMGCFNHETMKDIYDALYALDKNILVYGEPWNSGTTGIAESTEAKSAGTATSGIGYGAFDDDFRDGLKGGDGYPSGLTAAQIQGTFVNETYVLSGLAGKLIDKNKRNATGKPELAIHYAECHDNLTLYDKLAYSLNITESAKAYNNNKLVSAFPATVTAEQLSLIKSEVKLAGAYIFLSQGTPFINGGQEFLRTKKGNPDSYAADTKGGVTWTNTAGAYNIDAVNAIDLTMKEKYSDVYNTYKGLIALRKANPAAFGANTSATAEGKNGVTKYTTGDFLVYFNATDEAVSIEKSGYTKFIDVTSGTPSESTTFPTELPAKDFVILKK